MHLGRALIYTLSVFVLSCEVKIKKTNPIKPPSVSVADGYQIPNDSIKPLSPLTLKNEQINPKLFTLGNASMSDSTGVLTLLGDTSKNVIPKIITESISQNKNIQISGEALEMPLAKIIEAGEPQYGDNNFERFSNYLISQGLPSNTIQDIVFDNDNNLWTTVPDGILKFDGKYFYYYRIKTKKMFIESLVFSASDNSIWFGDAVAGVYKYDGSSLQYFKGLSSKFIKGKDGALLFLKSDSLIRFSQNQFKFIAKVDRKRMNWLITEDSKGHIWFGSDKNGVFKYNGRNFSQISTSEGLRLQYVYKILEDNNGDFWIGGDGIEKISGDKIIHYRELGSPVIWDLFLDTKSNLWIGTWGNGVYVFDKGRVVNYTKALGLCDDIIFSITEDKSGNHWFGSLNGGFSKLRSSGVKYISNNNEVVGKSGASLTKDTLGNIIISEKKAISTLRNGRLYSLINVNNEDYSFDNVFCDSKGRIWFYCNGLGVMEGKRIVFYDSKDNPEFKASIPEISEDKEGNIWFCARRTGLMKFDGKEFKKYLLPLSGFYNVVDNCFFDRKNVMWLGTRKGLLIVNKGKSVLFNDTTGFPANYTSRICEDAEGNLWIPTSEGLVRFDQGKFILLNEEYGLSKNQTNNALIDKNGNVWVYTAHGLNMLLKQIQKKLSSPLISIDDSRLFKVYNESDGFNSTDYIYQGFIDDNEGNIVLGLKNGLTVIKPETNDTTPPTTRILQVKLFGEDINWKLLRDSPHVSVILENGIEIGRVKLDSLSKYYHLPHGLKLSYNNNNISFIFLGITVNNAKKIKYRYKLEGYDKAWSTITAQTESSYGNLAPGSYTFIVRSMNADGVWSKDCTYEFTVSPPFWQTTWFRGLVILFIMIIVLMYIKWRERNLKKRQIELEETVERRTAEVVQKNHLIEEKQKEIMDSLRYAKRIQQSLMPTEKYIERNVTKLKDKK